MIILEPERVVRCQLLREAQGISRAEYVLVDNEIIRRTAVRPFPACADFPALVDFPRTTDRKEIWPVEIGIELSFTVVVVVARVVVRVGRVGRPAVVEES